MEINNIIKIEYCVDCVYRVHLYNLCVVPYTLTTHLVYFLSRKVIKLLLRVVS